MTALTKPKDTVIKEPVKVEDTSATAETTTSATTEDVRAYNVGDSDYSTHKIQPWDIWIEYELNPFDADIIKRVLRTKKGEDPIERYEKIIHVCKERIRQLTKTV